jgi:hypothetical protein
MWNLAPDATAGAESDVYLFALASATSDVKVYRSGPAVLGANGGGQFAFDRAAWKGFVDSNAGAVTLRVARFSAGKAVLVKEQPYVVAPEEMQGTIYYWSIRAGRIMRIKVGESQLDDFFAGTKDDWPANQASEIGCPACHTVSAKGSRLIMSTGSWDTDSDEHSRSYDLVKNRTDYVGPSETGNHMGAWAQAAISPDGNVVVQNAAPLRGENIAYETGAFDATSPTGQKLPSTGLDGKRLWMPAFSPDGLELAYVADGRTGGTSDAAKRDLRIFDWDATKNAATMDRLLVAAGTNPRDNVLGFPSMSPDHKVVIYQRSAELGSLDSASNAANGFQPKNPGNLYIANVPAAGSTDAPVETRLAALDGDAYPFAAGDRDRNLNYEATFAPVAAGGYYWVVFHSRRTYGNEATGESYVREGRGLKQLWVAAIDPNAPPGTDPSHPAFWLPGQDSSTLNMRGYWALDPCKGDGEGCASGTQCCGGYCAAPGGADAGAPVCASTQSTKCANVGDKCKTAADCCGAATSAGGHVSMDPSAGTQCINSVCSVPAPLPGPNPFPR